MKFGKFHGLALMGLGLVLLLGQAIVSYYAPGKPARSDSGANASSSSTAEKPAIPPIFGFMGGLALGVGVVILLISPKKTMRQELNEPSGK